MHTLVLTLALWAQDSTLIRSVTAFVDKQAQAGAFSGVVLIARDGEPLLELARGQADAERKRPIRTGTRFNLASGDKVFTKIAIAQLVDAGRLSLTDTVGKFLPDYPNATIRNKATINHLLRHQSGLGSYWNEAFRSRRTRLEALADVVPLFVNDALAFEPGARMGYSNAGYILLGRIIEVVNGESYYDYVRKNIFEPAGMQTTQYLTIDQWPADKAVGYTMEDSLGAAPRPSGPRAVNSWSLAKRGSSAGGGYSNVHDILRLDNALRSGKIAGAATAGRTFMTGPGGRQLLANGGGAGANFEFSRIGRYTVIILSNYDPPAATDVLRFITGHLANESTD
ncbi:MAG: serine hydrolase domain-containing protein [Gemmatimonadota bacterium]